jgi:hypothetical protein
MTLTIVFTVKEAGKDYIIIELPGETPIRLNFNPLEGFKVKTPIGTQVTLIIPIILEEEKR